MEDVLEVYKRPYDPNRPQICIDETSKQLLEHTRTPLPAIPGTLAREDDEYRRCGTSNIFLCVEPLTGRTVVKATEHRAKVDFAYFIRELCDGPYQHAEKLIVIMDNLNTHSLASLYEAFPPAEARRLVEKLEIHHTPKHGSRLDIAEIQLSVLGRQCLGQRMSILPLDQGGRRDFVFILKLNFRNPPNPLMKGEMPYCTKFHGGFLRSMRA
jgi:hypothetical protein